ncbi:MAG: hypothetical protein CSB44_10985 [Gammaproteobacteria bacterium]|nr:MAG: hypothetical protein CSB44_10985 [Gammaproteobacteria bacterium]PIE35822.1 MAG: hypothetical protein CSA54_05175 [Gammaproteobacteria bacterium]
MNQSDASSSVLAGIGLALLGFAVFSTHDALIKSIEGVPSVQIAFFVMLFSFVPFTLIVAVDPSERSLRPRLPVLVGLRSLFGAIGMLCGFHAFQNLPMAEVYSLLFAAPILITLLAIPILGERVHFVRGIAIALGMVGVLVVLRPGNSELTVHHLAAGICAVCVAATAIVTRKIGSREHGSTLVIFPMLMNILVAGVLTYFVYEPMPREAVVRLALIGCLSVAGQLLMVRAYRVSEAQFVAPMQYSQMLWALIFGAFVFGESVDRMVLIGSAIIVFSGLLFIWRELAHSLNRPVLSTRNLRFVSGPATKSSETDRNEPQFDVPFLQVPLPKEQSLKARGDAP